MLYKKVSSGELEHYIKMETKEKEGAKDGE